MSVQGFWGLQVVPDKTYSQVVTAPFRISMVALAEDAKGDKRSSVRVKVDKKEFVLCTLIPYKIEQQKLDITFVEGEEVSFTVTGSNTVHLTGNYVFDDEENESGDENMDDIAQLLQQRRGMIDDEAEVSDEDDEEEESEEEESEEEESEEEEEEESEEEEEPVQPVKKDNKKRPAETVKESTVAKKAKAEQKKEPEQKKPEQKKPEQKKQPEQKKPEQKKQEKKAEEKKESKVRKLPNGLIIEDVKIGNGDVAKSGKRVGMRYIGKLTNGKVFDKNVSGRPFNFLLGRGEVIKGWDIGVAGMKVGGERKLTIPAPLAYGKQGAPPDIPRNATLVFEVKLVNVK